MSFILDALKRVERERKLKQPGLASICAETESPRKRRMWPWIIVGCALLANAVAVTVMFRSPHSPQMSAQMSSDRGGKKSSKADLLAGKKVPARRESLDSVSGVSAERQLPKATTEKTGSDASIAVAASANNTKASSPRRGSSLVKDLLEQAQNKPANKAFPAPEEANRPALSAGNEDIENKGFVEAGLSEVKKPAEVDKSASLDYERDKTPETNTAALSVEEDKFDEKSMEIFEELEAQAAASEPLIPQEANKRNAETEVLPPEEIKLRPKKKVVPSPKKEAPRTKKKVEPANETAIQPTRKTEPAPASNTEVVLLRDLSESERRSLPDLEMSAHFYSSNRSRRFIFIGSLSYSEGDSIGPNGPVVEEITPEGAIINNNGVRVMVPIRM